MELDELKIHLKQKIDDDRGQKSPADIAILLTRKTNSIIHKLKKSLWFEIASCFIFIMIFGYLSIFNQYTSIRIYFSAFTILIIAFLLLLFYLLKKVNQLSGSNLPIKENLISLHSLLKEFTKRYFQFTMSLLPICLFFSAYLGYQDGKNGVIIDGLDSLASKFNNGKELIIFLIVYIIILTVGTYYFTKWYIKKLYGKYLDQLQDCINELN